MSINPFYRSLATNVTRAAIGGYMIHLYCRNTELEHRVNAMSTRIEFMECTLGVVANYVIVHELTTKDGNIFAKAAMKFENEFKLSDKKSEL